MNTINWSTHLSGFAGGLITAVRKHTLTVQCTDGKTRRMRFQRDAEGNPGEVGLFGAFPRFKNTPYNSLAALKGMTIALIENTVDEEPFAQFDSSYMADWPRLVLTHPEDERASTLEIGCDDEGNGPGWVEVL